ncbi:hypothetical protein GXM_09079 [Nostoc sphaeroides CCNUC1]|uniref:Uncharacterized protein n=1 Tax=Nostoc sphaeroides CCNUC1 TaxID=2653204 RepID=A0A5P8WFH6_9NOSO|nr:hypothetical protein GXM_09079 [Nostoc sphaeroides CCNUC1]
MIISDINNSYSGLPNLKIRVNRNLFHAFDGAVIILLLGEENRIYRSFKHNYYEYISTKPSAKTIKQELNFSEKELWH